jgi:hypothetical protein
LILFRTLIGNSCARLLVAGSQTEIRQTRTASGVDTIEASARRSRSSIWNARTPPPVVPPVAQQRLTPSRATALVPQAEGERRAKWAPILYAWVRCHLDRNSRQGYEACKGWGDCAHFSLADFPGVTRAHFPAKRAAVCLATGYPTPACPNLHRDRANSPAPRPNQYADFRWERSHPNANSPSSRASPCDANHVHSRLAPARSAARC